MQECLTGCLSVMVDGALRQQRMGTSRTQFPICCLSLRVWTFDLNQYLAVSPLFGNPMCVVNKQLWRAQQAFNAVLQVSSNGCTCMQVCACSGDIFSCRLTQELDGKYAPEIWKLIAWCSR